MATASKTYTFVAGTTAEASKVNQNFDDLVGFLNNSVVHADGSVAFSGIPSLPGTNPTADNQAARKAYVDTAIRQNGGRWAQVTNTALSVPHNTNTTATYATEDYDPWGWVNLGSNNTRVTPTTAGWYRVQFYLNFNAGTFAATDRLFAQVRLNGSTIGRDDRAAGVTAPSLTLVTRVVQCNGTTDYLDCVVVQTSGATRSAIVSMTVEAMSLS